MIPSMMVGDIDNLVRRAHRPWLQTVCSVLGSVPESLDAGSLIADLPPTNNGDVAHCLAQIIRRAEGDLPWKALGVSIDICASISARRQQEQHIELLWTGP